MSRYQNRFRNICYLYSGRLSTLYHNNIANMCTSDAFMALLRAGLWENGVRLSRYGNIDFSEIYRLAGEQTVTGVVTAGLEHVEDIKIAKQNLIPFLAKVISIEQRNEAMNNFICSIVGKMRTAGIDTLLVKGQGIAQCYTRPQWRIAGDIDLFLDNVNFEKAKAFLLPLSSSPKTANTSSRHISMTIRDEIDREWYLELHQNLRRGLSSGIDKTMDALRDDTFEHKHIRVWNNGGTDIHLPAPDNDIIFTFTHIIKHFYKGGIGLRQICDWCRLIWTYRESIDAELLTERIRSMRLMSEWKAFASYAVDFLGMPGDAMPLYDAAPRWSRKAVRLHAFILKVGNFGQGRGTSYYVKYPYIIRKAISAWLRISDAARHIAIFPLDSLRFLPQIVYNGLHNAVKNM